MNKVTYKMKGIHTRNTSQLSHYWRVSMFGIWKRKNVWYNRISIYVLIRPVIMYLAASYFTSDQDWLNCQTGRAINDKASDFNWSSEVQELTVYVVRHLNS